MIEQYDLDPRPKAPAGPAYICPEPERTVSVGMPFWNEETQSWDSEEEEWDAKDVEDALQTAARLKTQRDAFLQAMGGHAFTDPSERTYSKPFGPQAKKWVSGIGHLGLAGKDTWDRDVDLLLAEMTENTGKDLSALVDRVSDSSVKGELRTALWGLLREIALQRQANVALRQQVGRKRAIGP